MIGFGLLFGSCVDDLEQMPVTETTSDEVYSQAENYKKVLAKIYASYVLAGQGQGGANGDLSTINGQDFSRGYFNLQEAATDEVANTWLSGNNLVDLTYINWSSKTLGYPTLIIGYTSTLHSAMNSFVTVRMRLCRILRHQNKKKYVDIVQKSVL